MRSWIWLEARTMVTRWQLCRYKHIHYYTLIVNQLNIQKHMYFKSSGKDKLHQWCLVIGDVTLKGKYKHIDMTNHQLNHWKHCSLSWGFSNPPCTFLTVFLLCFKRLLSQGLLKKHEAFETDFTVHRDRVNDVCTNGDELIKKVVLPFNLYVICSFL